MLYIIRVRIFRGSFSLNCDDREFKFVNGKELNKYFKIRLVEYLTLEGTHKDH